MGLMFEITLWPNDHLKVNAYLGSILRGLIKPIRKSETKTPIKPCDQSFHLDGLKNH